MNIQKSIPSILRWLWTIARGNRLQMILNVIVGLLQVTASLFSVYAMRYAIDVASHAVEGEMVVAIVFIGSLILFEFALTISGIWIRNILGIRAQNRMQQIMLERVLRSEWHSGKKYHSGDVINRLEEDVRGVVTFLTETLPSALSTLVLFLGAFLYLFSMDHLLALITIAIIPVCLLLSKFYVKKMRRLNRNVRDSESRIQSMMQDTVQNSMLIKTLECTDMMISRIKNRQGKLRHHVARRTFFSVLSNLTLNLGFASSYLLTFAWGAVRLSGGSLTFGGMTAFLQLVHKIQNPARSLAHLLPQSVAVFTAAERLMELEDIPEEKGGENRLMKSPCGIYINKVSFRYDEASPEVFSSFSCSFPPGTSTAILGETGSGKTTLIRLLLSLVHPSEGAVTIGAQESSAEEISHLHRCNFVYVPQGNTLMSGTIRENLRLGKPDATEEEMQNALHECCADFVFELPDGLDTRCSESGGGLSEGQAQRISIARALLRNRPVMLFDEATSALDPDTERLLLTNLFRSRQKTVLFITHRLAVCEYCDHVLRL